MFRRILSEQWAALSPVLQKHYGISNNEEIKMQGELDVKHGKIIKFIMPLIRLTGALVPVEGEKFSVTVENKRTNDIFFWHRKFEKDNKVYEFNSKMQQYENDIIEFVGFDIGIRMTLNVSDKGLVYRDKGYVLKIGKKMIPIPLHILIGRAVIEEYVCQTDVNDFNMKFVVHHPWFGFVFSYSGYFNCVCQSGAENQES